MNKLFLAFCLTLISSVLTFAQTDFRKGEVYVGYTNNQVDTGANRPTSVTNFFEDRETLHGVQVSGVANVSRYVGIKGDFSIASKKDDFSTSFGTGATLNNVSGEIENRVINVLGGVQFKDNASEARLKPFAHILGGIGNARLRTDDVTCSNTALASCTAIQFENSETGLAGAFGGGLDVKLSNRVDLRLIQVDYNPMRLNGSNSHNFRFGIGLAFR